MGVRVCVCVCACVNALLMRVWVCRWLGALWHVKSSLAEQWCGQSCQLAIPLTRNCLPNITIVIPSKAQHPTDKQNTHNSQPTSAQAWLYLHESSMLLEVVLFMIFPTKLCGSSLRDITNDGLCWVESESLCFLGFFVLKEVFISPVFIFSIFINQNRWRKLCNKSSSWAVSWAGSVTRSYQTLAPQG